MPPGFSLEREASHKSQAELLKELLSDKYVIAIGIIQDSEIKFANQAMAELFGYSREELMRWNRNDLEKTIHPEDRFLIMEQTPKKQITAKDIMIPYSYRIITNSGEVRWVEEYSMPFLYEGKAAKFVTFIDISTRKQTDEALQESECRYRLLEKELRESEAKNVTLVEHAKDGLAIAQEGIVKFANRALAEFLGLTIDELVGMPFIELVAPESKEFAAQRYKLRLAGVDVPSVYELKLKTIDETIKDVEISVGIIQYQGAPATIAIVRNVTMRKQAEEALRQAKKELELRIEQRTTELRQANEQLRREINERKQTELELYKLSQFLESIIDNTNVWLDVLDSQANVVIWNKAAEAISGYSREEVVGHGKVWEWLYPDETYRTEVFAKATAIIEGGDVDEDDLTTIRCKDGQHKSISWYSRNLMDEKGTPIGSIAIGRDISQRKQAEEALRESEAQLRAQYKGIPIPTYTWQWIGDDFKLVDYNNAALVITEGNVTNLVGKPAQEMFHDRPDVQEDLMRCLTKKTSIKREIQYWFTFGKSKDLAVSYVFVPPDLVMVHTEDITERKRAEEALRESEAKYSSLVENAKDGVVIVQDGIFQFVNRAMAELSGYKVEKIVGKPFSDLVAPESRHLVSQKYISRLAGENVPGRLETKIQCKDETIKDVELTASMIKYNGLPAATAIVRDITARKQAEEAKRDLEERRANFIAITSHELRTPLTVIKGYGEILAHKLDELDDEIKLQCFRAINRNVRRLERLITGVTTLDQLERGIFRLEKTEMDFFNFLMTALQPYQTRLGSQLEVRVIHERDHVGIEVDPDRILQVLDNLLENAIKHTHREHRKIIVTSEIQSQVVRVKVTDNGAGISSEDLERIFEPFMSIPTKFSVGGTGIGLNISRMIVKAHGGTLTAYSEGKGQGATFVMELLKKRMGETNE